LDSNFFNFNNSLSNNDNSILNSNGELKDAIFKNSNLPPIGFEDDDDLDVSENNNNNNNNNNNTNNNEGNSNEIVSLDKKEKKNVVDEEEEEYFRSYKNMFESQMEPPPDFNEDELLADEEEMLKDILQEEENDYLQAMYEEDMAQQNQSLPAPPPIPTTPQQKSNVGMNSQFNENQSITSPVSTKQKGKRPALEFEDDDELDFTALSNNKNNDTNVDNPLNALNNYMPSSTSHTQNTLEWEHKNKKSMSWDTGVGFSFTDDSEPLVWQNPSNSKNVENSILEWDEFMDINDQAQSSNPLQSRPATTTTMNVDSKFGKTTSLDKNSSTSSGRNFTERPEAGTVYLTGYSYDNLPLYIPFKPIPTVNEIHRQNKELTVKNMNGQLLDVSIYQLLEEVEKERKEKKEIQEAKEVIQQYNVGENQEEYMEICEDDKGKKKEKGKGKENEDRKEEYEKDLWVNAYTPKRYTDLLGDEVRIFETLK